jgi:DNA polymerase III epsilon subunit-like protein
LAGLELRDRAFHFLANRGSATENELLTHVYGGSTPPALRAKLAEPLLADPRLERDADGRWRVRSDAPATGFTALALVASGPSPLRAHVVGLHAVYVDERVAIERFGVTLNPGVRVPRYALDRLGVELDALRELPTFGDVVDDLTRFFDRRAVLAQDAALTWEFIAVEARRLGRTLAQPRLIDFNDLASERLALRGKPSLSVVAAQLGIGSVHVARVDEEARLLGLAGARLLAEGRAEASRAPAPATALRRGATARALPDQPGVYVLRDGNQTPLYVGKARRLRSRLAAYVHRPVGVTRRLEGLVGSVEAVDTTECPTDLEALILEDREIRRLQPRFNTVRQQRAPRVWIRWPYQRTSARGVPLAPPRLELSPGPHAADGEFVGPFRNEAIAEAARLLAREVFELDSLRRERLPEYWASLAEAWRFLGGASEVADARARMRSVGLLRKVAAFDVGAQLLPADPAVARYAVLRPGNDGVEGFLLDRAVLCAWRTLDDELDSHAFARSLLQRGEPRTQPADARVVLRWFGALRPPARLVHLPDGDDQSATDRIENAVLDMLDARRA